MKRTTSVLAAVSLLAGALLVTGAVTAEDAEAPKTVEEPESGIHLPVSLDVLDGGETHTLTGVAIREKTFLKVDVYACGHYVKADVARTELAKWKDKTAKELVDDDDFREKLLSPGFARSLRLHMARDVDSDDFNEAFEESLKPRIERLVEDGVKGKVADIETLKGLFTLDELTEGTKLDFTWMGTTLTVAMDATKLGAIESDALCRAMWDIYFGEDPIQDEFPRKLMSLFPGVLKPDAAK